MKMIKLSDSEAYELYVKNCTNYLLKHNIYTDGKIEYSFKEWLLFGKPKGVTGVRN